MRVERNNFKTKQKTLPNKYFNSRNLAALKGNFLNAEVSLVTKNKI